MGRLAYGFYVVTDGVVTMTDKEGKPAEDATGKRYVDKLLPNEDERTAASRMTKELRKALQGTAPVNGFEPGRKINYPKRGKI
jgi:hypothetical protein